MPKSTHAQKLFKQLKDQGKTPKSAKMVAENITNQSVSTGKKKKGEEIAMPKNTKVHKVFEALKKQGKSVGSAARIAQSVTGKSLATGKKPKKNKK